MFESSRDPRDHCYQLRLTSDEHTAIMAAARVRDMTAADLLRKAFAEYLEAHALPPKRRGRRRA